MCFRIRTACWALALTSRIVVAQRSELPLRHLNHTGWTTFDVPALQGAYRIARSNDGYLWINAHNGVLRFDGARFVLLDSTASPLLAVRTNREIRPVLVDRGGTLWLQRSDRAVITYRDGVFRLAVPADTSFPVDFTMDGAGRVFAYSASDDGKVFEIRDGRAVRVPLPLAVTQRGVTRIVSDTGRGLWIGSVNGLWHYVDGQVERTSIRGAQPGLARPLLQTRDGTLWATGVGVGSGLERIVNGRSFAVRTGDSTDIVDALGAVEDSAGAVWISTHGHGLLRWDHGRLESYTKRDGLTDVVVNDISLDAHGGAIVVTGAGLDRFRATSFVTLDARDGVQVESPQRVIADESGSLWTTGIDGHAVIEFRSRTTALGADTIVAMRAALPSNDSYEVLGPARGGGIWVGTRFGMLFRYRNGHVDRQVRVPDFAGVPFRFVVEEADGDVWLGREHLALARLRHDRFVESPVGFTSGIVEDSRGHVWIADAEHPVLDEVVGGRIVRQIGPREGLPGFVSSLVLERDDLLWAMTDSGLARIANGRVSIVHSSRIDFIQRYGPDLMIAGGYLWLVSDDRIGRIALTSLRAAADGATTRVVPTDFVPDDGLASPRRFDWQMRTVARESNGRLWFATPAGLALFDSTREVKLVAPRPRVEEIAAHGRLLFDSARRIVAPNPDRVTIHFSAPDLTSPERQRFQFRLDGVDRTWIDGTAHAATYTELRPHGYVFHVRTWAGDSTAAPPQETTLAFRVEPTWYQLTWLRVMAALLAATWLAAAAALWQRRRLRASTARLRAQFDVRLAERTRIARDLHDTLLQGFTGLVLQLEGLRRTVDRKSTSATAEELTRILQLADSTLLDARRSVWDIRSVKLDERSVDQSIESICREIAGGHGLAMHFGVFGAPRSIHSEASATALNIVREAMRNVVMHARATTVNVEIRYQRDLIEICIVDDGVGMKSETLSEAAKEGHFGIVGMRERAANLGGSVDVDALEGKGTRVTVALPCEPARRSVSTSPVLARRSQATR